MAKKTTPQPLRRSGVETQTEAAAAAAEEETAAAAIPSTTREFI